ncbi:MAG TPA: chromate efflux transporter [Chloroflexota bacterium]|nr:chromate efflux transporter [Chloroflexota bacterium]
MASIARAEAREDHLPEVMRLFTKLGFIGFGGPAAHIAMMRDEVVVRRKWLGEQEFLDLLGAASLIPGPSSTELSMYLGLRRAGWRGLIAAGVCFISPAMLIVLGIAWLYVAYGRTPAGENLLYGIKPAVVAIIIQALWGLGKTAVKGKLFAVVGLAAAVLYVLGGNPLALLAAGGLAIMLVRNWRSLGSKAPLVVFGLPPLYAAGDAIQGSADLTKLFLIFLKLGCIVFGSGYVLLAFLRGDLVAGQHWLTDQQLLDAVAVGQFTPGPVFTTATFIGYVVAGVPGALLATLGIFLPGFVLIPAIDRAIAKVKTSPWAGAFLDGINVAALGVMAGVTYQLGRAAVTDPLTVGILVLAILAVFRWKLNAAWLVLGGGVVGLARLLV